MIQRACSIHYLKRIILSYIIFRIWMTSQWSNIPNFWSLLNIVYLRILRIHAFSSRFEESSRLCWFSYLLLNRYCVSHAFHSLAVLSLKITMHLVVQKLWAPDVKTFKHHFSFSPSNWNKWSNNNSSTSQCDMCYTTWNTNN